MNERRPNREDLEAENAALREVVEDLRAEIEQLKARIFELERRAGRNSNNSSLPPSRDDNKAREERANRAARRRAQREARRKPGKQPGDPGKNLAQVTDPDEVVDHVPTHCGDCGASLAKAEVTGREVRQVFDLPARRREVTEHVAEWRRCSCGCETGGAFPPEATAPTAWGPQVRAYGIYLMNRQLIPVERTAEILSDLLGAPVSTGFLAGLAARAAEGLEDFSTVLADCLADEEVVHVDETGSRVAGTKWWWHVASTSLLTFLGIHPKRGVEATDAFGILPRFSGILVHDRWAPYWRYDQAGHAICNAHILRDLEDVAAYLDQEEWAEAMSRVLVDAKAVADAAAEAGLDAVPIGQYRWLRGRYNAIVEEALEANPEPRRRKRNAAEKAAYNLAVALRDHADEILLFISDLRVSFDNNRAERDLRMAKLQQKISGTFRTEAGARNFARIRSYIETGRKHGLNPVDLLTDLFMGRPWMIPQTT
ncbi:MAG TPA: IS66 family transposase [Acidimicrobiales bacterium]|nr:IS66 family transposase [Acidimicrobiales bacterium]